MTEEQYENRFKPMAEIGKRTPGAERVSTVGMREPGYNLLRYEAIDALKRVNLPVRKGGLFKHPKDWTEQEDEAIIELLRAQVPLYVIANKVHAERRCLVKHIEETPWLRELREDMDEAALDAAEYQMGRLITQGNPTMIMWFLDQKGAKRGYGPKGMQMSEESGSGQRIVMGTISAEEVEEAEKLVKETTGRLPDGTVPSSTGFEVEDAAKEAMDKAQGVEGFPEGEEGESGHERAAKTPEVPPFAMATGGQMAFADADAMFADGEYSPFGM